MAAVRMGGASPTWLIDCFRVSWWTTAANWTWESCNAKALKRNTFPVGGSFDPLGIEGNAGRP